jgi:tetratricopeptide (TPR) repeat protein
MAIKTRVDDDWIERVVDHEDFEKAIERQVKTVENLRRNLEKNETEQAKADLGRAVQRLSEWYRWTEQWNESLKLKDEAIAIWAELGRERARTLVLLQKALTQHFAGDKEAAYTRFDLLLSRLNHVEELQSYLDFAHDWRARCLARDGRFEEAKADMEEALKLRTQRGNEPHIQETRRLLDSLSTIQ